MHPTASRFVRLFPGLFGLLACCLFLSCARKIYNIAHPALADGRYDTEFPYGACSREIASVGSTMHLLNSIAYYKAYILPENEQWKLGEINRTVLEKRTTKIIYFNNTASGTATVILSEPHRIALMTCAHIVDFPDTIVRYNRNEQNQPVSVQSIAFKEKQNNYITDITEGGEMSILYLNREADFAIVAREFSAFMTNLAPVFDFPRGKASELDWGNYVYLLGFPRGNKMVTSGLVSLSDRERSGDFLVDAPFNRGFSGGLVLAIRDGVPHFELVGMAKSAAAEYEYVIRPPDNINFDRFDERTPYRGDLFVDYKANIQYGVTNVTALETIIRLLRQNEKTFLSRGYDFRKFYGEK